MTAGYTTAALSTDGSLGLAYLPANATLTVNMAKMRGPTLARWFDPTAGTYTTIATGMANSGTHSFTPPATNSGGGTDWLLVLTTQTVPPTTTTTAARPRPPRQHPPRATTETNDRTTTAAPTTTTTKPTTTTSVAPAGSLTCPVVANPPRPNDHLYLPLTNSPGGESPLFGTSYARPLAGTRNQGRTTTTEQWAWVVQWRLTEPRRAPVNSPRPREPTTSNSAPLDSSISTRAA